MDLSQQALRALLGLNLGSNHANWAFSYLQTGKSFSMVWRLCGALTPVESLQVNVYSTENIALC